MHTTTYTLMTGDNGGEEWIVNHNGDFSGNVTIRREGDQFAAEFPMELILCIAGDYANAKIVEHIEQEYGADVIRRLVKRQTS